MNNNDYDQIEQLMLIKDFEALNFQERKFIQDKISPDTYQQQRTILINSKQILSQKPPLPEAKLNDLQAYFKATHSNISSSRSATMPIYQAVLWATFIGFVIWWYRPTRIETKIQKEIIYLPIVDTIFQEKLVEKKTTIYKTKIVHVPVLQIDTVYIPTIDKEQFYQEKESPIIFAQNTPKGKTMKDMEDLMHFVVGAN